MPPKTLPTKLVKDSIVEALVELRFEAAGLAEVLVGRLADSDAWAGFKSTRLPTSGIPEEIREQEENLRYQPIVELQSDDGSWRVRIGPRSISLHNIGEYCGWEKFKPRIHQLLESLFSGARDARVLRIGFRYVNALTKQDHLIKSVNDLNIQIHVDEAEISDPVNLNYLKDNDPTHTTTARIASPFFVKGNIPANSGAIVDIDVSTPLDFSETNKERIISWIDDAHILEKTEFFSLIPDEILSQIVKEW